MRSLPSDPGGLHDNQRIRIPLANAYLPPLALSLGPPLLGVHLAREPPAQNSREVRPLRVAVVGEEDVSARSGHCEDFVLWRGVRVVSGCAEDDGKEFSEKGRLRG